MKQFVLDNKARVILGQILELSQAKKKPLYIVGGFLRDIVLGRKRHNPDIDFAVKKNAVSFARILANKLKAGFVVLDKANGCARVVKKAQDKIYTLDFTDFRGKGLNQDLLKRDFTINALAVELGAFLQSLATGWEDPHGGLRDLKLRVIRVLTNRAYDEDPLRIMRAFSFSSLLDFKIEPKTLSAAVKKRRKLLAVSGERMRDELFKILSSERAGEFLVTLDKHKILELIFPEIKAMRCLGQGPYHHLGVLKHTLETVVNLEKIIKISLRNLELSNYLEKELSFGRRRQEALKLAALVHDIGKPSTLRIKEGKVMFHGHEHKGSRMFNHIADRLKISNAETAVLKKIILLHLRPGYLANNSLLTARAKFRFFRDAGEEAVSILLLSLADQRSTHGPLATKKSRARHERVVRRLIKEYFLKSKEKKAPALLNGDDLIRRFKLKPSALIGRILAQIQESQAIGKIKTKSEAFKIASSVIKKNNAG